MSDFNTPTGWNENSKLKLQWLTDKQELALSTTLKQDKKYNGKEHLIWDTDAILKDLKENHVTIEDNAEVMWYRWKNVHIELPAVWDFEWFKFDYFVSDDRVYKYIFRNDPELEKKSYSMSDISKLLKAINSYMSELQGKSDKDMDYENDLKMWENLNFIFNRRCNAWDCLKAITWLHYWFWLSDRNVAWHGGLHARLDCSDDNCRFYSYYHAYSYNDANLLLKLSD